MGEERILAPSIRSRVVGALFVALPFYLASKIPGAKRDDVSGVALLAVIAAAFAVPIARSMVLVRWRVNDRGLERLMPPWRSIPVAWTDVLSVREGPFGSIAVASKHVRTFFVSGRLRGIEVLRRSLLARAPPSAMTDDVRRKLELSLDGASATAVPVDAPEPVEASGDDPVARWREDPFFVLGVAPECSRAEVERAGQKLLALLAIGNSAARKAATPLGEIERTADTVRAAMAELRDPDKRIVHEAWARVGADAIGASSQSAGESDVPPWTDAMAAMGWRAR